MSCLKMTKCIQTVLDMEILKPFFSRRLLTFIKIKLKLAFSKIHIFGSITNQKVIDI